MIHLKIPQKNKTGNINNVQQTTCMRLVCPNNHQYQQFAISNILCQVIRYTRGTLVWT